MIFTLLFPFLLILHIFSMAVTVMMFTLLFPFLLILHIFSMAVTVMMFTLLFPFLLIVHMAVTVMIFTLLFPFLLILHIFSIAVTVMMFTLLFPFLLIVHMAVTVMIFTLLFPFLIFTLLFPFLLIVCLQTYHTDLCFVTQEIHVSSLTCVLCLRTVSDPSPLLMFWRRLRGCGAVFDPVCECLLYCSSLLAIKLKSEHDVATVSLTMMCDVRKVIRQGNVPPSASAVPGCMTELDFAIIGLEKNWVLLYGPPPPPPLVGCFPSSLQLLVKHAFSAIVNQWRFLLFGFDFHHQLVPSLQI